MSNDVGVYRQSHLATMAIQALNSILVEIREAAPCHAYDDFKGVIWSHTLPRQWYRDIESPQVGLVATRRVNQAITNYMCRGHTEPESNYLLRHPQFLASDPSLFNHHGADPVHPSDKGFGLFVAQLDQVLGRIVQEFR